MENRARDPERGYQRQPSNDTLENSLYHDEVAEVAKGGLVEDLPPGYYYSMNFIGTLTAACGASIAAYLGISYRQWATPPVWMTKTF